MEYAPAEVDTFIAFADAVEEEFEGVMVDGVEVRHFDATPLLCCFLMAPLGCTESTVVGRVDRCCRFCRNACMRFAFKCMGGLVGGPGALLPHLVCMLWQLSGQPTEAAGSG